MNAAIDWKPKVGDWILLKASYCSPDSEVCSDKEPCRACLKMCNRFVISGNHYDKDYFFGGHWCNRDGGDMLDTPSCYVMTRDTAKLEPFCGISHISEFIPIPYEDWIPEESQ